MFPRHPDRFARDEQYPRHSGTAWRPFWWMARHLLATTGLRLAPEKVQVDSSDKGFDFLGFHIQRHTQKGSHQSYAYSYPSEKSITSIRRRINAMTTRQSTYRSATVLFHRLNRMIRGRAQYFRHGRSSAACHDLGHYLWWRVWGWLRDKHPRPLA